MRKIGIAQYQGKPPGALPVLLQNADVAGLRRAGLAEKPIVPVGAHLNHTDVAGLVAGQVMAASQGKQRKHNRRLGTGNTKHGQGCHNVMTNCNVTGLPDMESSLPVPVQFVLQIRPV